MTSGSWRDRVPPTVKQLKLLKELGCEIEPETLLEAERLIDAFLGSPSGRYEIASEV